MHSVAPFREKTAPLPLPHPQSPPPKSTKNFPDCGYEIKRQHSLQGKKVKGKTKAGNTEPGTPQEPTTVERATAPQAREQIAADHQDELDQPERLKCCGRCSGAVVFMCTSQPKKRGTLFCSRVLGNPKYNAKGKKIGGKLDRKGLEGVAPDHYGGQNGKETKAGESTPTCPLYQPSIRTPLIRTRQARIDLGISWWDLMKMEPPDS